MCKGNVMAESSQILYPKWFMNNDTGDENSADAVDKCKRDGAQELRNAYQLLISD